MNKEKQLAHDNKMRENLHAGMMRDQMWGMIQRAAIHDPILKDLLDGVELYWRLKYDGDGKLEPDV